MEDNGASVLADLETITDFQNMKVADLKRELKLRGLSTVGNKSDLIERLTQITTYKPVNTSALTDDTNSISSVEDETGMSYDDRLDFIDSKDDDLNEKDDSAIEYKSVPVDDYIEPNVALEVDPKESFDSQPTHNKSQSAKTSNFQEKKLLLNRTSCAFPIITAATVSAILKSSEETNKPPKTIISGIDMTPQERLQLRAKRFNTGSNTTNGTGGTIKSNKEVKKADAILNVKSTTPDVDVLKKRAERFGQNVSTVMKQIEEKEKVLKRKLRFGCPAGAAPLTGLTKVDEAEKKRIRAERFANE